MQLCIDFGGSEIKLGLLERDAPLAARSLVIGGTPEDLSAAAAAARGLIAEHGRPSAVGIAVPGVVDTAVGRMIQANAKYAFLSDSSMDLREWGRACFGLPTIVENDARAALVGELAFGCVSGESDVVMVTLGTGIGTAAAMDGRVLRGAHDHAGILGGHCTIDVSGPVCTCGNIGCAEALASGAALRSAQPGLGGIRDLVVGAETDSALADLLADYLRYWGAAVVTLCHSYDPEAVVLSGGVLRAGERIVDPIRQYVDAHLWPSSHRPRFAVPTNPEFSVLKGLAVLANMTSAEESIS